MAGIDLSWLGGGIGGMLRSGRKDNAGGSAYGGQRTLGKDFLEGVGGATDPQFKSEAKKARSLRSYLAEIDPTMKDKVQAWGLEDLEGHAMSLAQKRQEAKDKLNEEYMRQQIAQMQNVEAGRQRDAAATTAFSRYAMAPAAQEQWGTALANGPTQTGAALLNAPLRAPTADETRSAFIRSLAGGGNPDKSVVNAMRQFAPSNVERNVVPQAFSVNGMEGIYSPTTGAIHVRPTPAERAAAGTTPKATVDPFDRMDYAQMLKTEAELNVALAKAAPGDAKGKIADELLRLKKRMDKLRSGTARQTPADQSNPLGLDL